jgi:hypothetical protein
MIKKRKIKIIEPKMEFNPGTMKYEPKLSLRKTKENIKKRMDIRDLIMFIIILVIAAGIIFWALINGFI